MKISTFILSVFGCCIFYICNADWIDDLLEDYLGSDYEDVAPFISSVTAGTEEFDQLVEELTQSKLKWFLPSPAVLLVAVFALGFSVLLCFQRSRLKGGRLASVWHRMLSVFRKSGSVKEEGQSSMVEFLERKLKRLCECREGEEVPVKLLWKGGSLMESSINCGVRKESKLQHIQRHLLQSQLLFKDGSGDDTLTMVPSVSDSSTVQRMAEIRKLLESEQELGRGVGWEREKDGEEEASEKAGRVDQVVRRRREREDRESEYGGTGREEVEGGIPDPKLMSRIRLLESRLRLEELKNKNWISRMSRAEGILQQLNKQENITRPNEKKVATVFVKYEFVSTILNLDRLTEDLIRCRKELTQAYSQVERIEETRPVGTLTETLKITSTVTNWAPPSQPPPSPPPSIPKLLPTPPRRNSHLTMVSPSPPFSPHAPYTSLSELIRKEIGLPPAKDLSSALRQLPPAPSIPVLSGPSPPSSVPQSSFLSKFFCR